MPPNGLSTSKSTGSGSPREETSQSGHIGSHGLWSSWESGCRAGFSMGICDMCALVYVFQSLRSGQEEKSE